MEDLECLQDQRPRHGLTRLEEYKKAVSCYDKTLSVNPERGQAFYAWEWRGRPIRLPDN